MGNPKEVLDIKTEDLKAAAPTFHKQSEHLQTALHQLQTKLAELGSPWGGDEQGQKFAHQYNPHKQQIEKAAGILVEGLASVHEAMKDMADGHIDNDEAVKSLFTRQGVEGKGSHPGQGKS
ncbi:WXG100 family type VII secretion target [Streptomyces sp. ODS28]|uniref:WXG100 family type VII secretion target n=1 Tax=Streptomyces sp. ODS28 TaxID=3136688 RepID=UPI0031E710A4